jgi:cholinesterase
LLTDELFWHGLHRTILSRLSFKDGGRNYLYHFTVDSPTFNHYKLLMCGPGVRGACHADDLSYLFKNIMGKRPDEGSLELRTIQRMVGVFTQFAKSGNPNDPAVLESLKWEAIDGKTPPFKCLNIAEDLAIIDLPETTRMLAWDAMYKPGTLF